eukprot:2907369-Amphidinium_carterae.1
MDQSYAVRDQWKQGEHFETLTLCRSGYVWQDAKVAGSLGHVIQVFKSLELVRLGSIYIRKTPGYASEKYVGTVYLPLSFAILTRRQAMDLELPSNWGKATEEECCIVTNQWFRVAPRET